ncbi:glycosyltransferase family 4 protein [Priestia megaterium NCT-2]|uniref:glycosyltransferase n=1 Tax=Priestia megaterium TaxID=1404 RepID=UPI00034843FD|nr:glycosyltransferase [Priestia megaterium]AYE52410.1 glycosyltransferase family 4 protein [Priestia megaterium NCT-2]
MDRKKIMLIMHDINYGGAAKMFTFLANGLSEAGNDVYVYTFEGMKPNYSLSPRIKFIPAKAIPRNLVYRRLLPFVQVRKTIKKVKPDVVIPFLPNANLYSYIGTVLTKTSLIITERSDPFYERGLLMDIKRFFYRFADGAVFQTEGARDYYGNILQKKGIVIPNPVTIEKKKRIPNNKKKNEIAFVARFDIKQKRQDVMISAFQRVAEVNPDVKLVFYGDGNDMRKIKDMVDELNLTDRVVFLGKVNNILDVIQSSRLYVSTSDYEGISNSLIEAMSIGLPVVSTDCSPGGARMLIENEVNGILVPTGDAEMIAKSIIFLLKNSEVADGLGEKAQMIIDRFNPEKIIKLWDDYIDGIVKK